MEPSFFGEVIPIETFHAGPTIGLRLTLGSGFAVLAQESEIEHFFEFVAHLRKEYEHHLSMLDIAERNDV